jgi:hypothetical protein
VAKGRKPYKPSEVDKEIVYALRLEKVPMTQIVDKLGICYDTYLKYKTYFEDTIKKADALSDIRDLMRVKNALFKKATGYKTEELEYILNEEGQEVLKSKKIKEFAPDTTACIFYLVNKSDGEFISINKEQNINLNNDDLVKALREFAIK